MATEIINIPSLPSYPDETVTGKIAIANPTTEIAYEVDFKPSDLSAVSQPSGLMSLWFGVDDPTGWLVCDGDTIGSSGSSATHKGTDYQNLYNHLWDMIKNQSANLTVSGGIGTTAAADWAANKPIDIPNCQGLNVGGIGTQTVNTRTKGRLTNLGDIEEDGAPDIEGSFALPQLDIDSDVIELETDAFSKSTTPPAIVSRVDQVTGTSTNRQKVVFAASDSDDAYGRSTYVAPNEIGVNFIIKL